MQRAAAGAQLPALTAPPRSLATGSNGITAAGAQALAAQLGQPAPDLVKRGLRQPLKRLPSVTDLRLDRNPLEAGGVAALAYALRTNSCITSLDLQGVRAGDAGAASLALALRSNRTLVTLHLQVRGRRGEPLALLRSPVATAAAVPPPPTPRHCQENAIRDSGMESLTEALRKCPTLQSLNLQGNLLSVGSRFGATSSLAHIASGVPSAPAAPPTSPPPRMASHFLLYQRRDSQTRAEWARVARRGSVTSRLAVGSDALAGHG